jgi:hypothetical protein
MRDERNDYYYDVVFSIKPRLPGTLGRQTNYFLCQKPSLSSGTRNTKRLIYRLGRFQTEVQHPTFWGPRFGRIWMGACYSHLSYRERLAIMDGRRNGLGVRHLPVARPGRRARAARAAGTTTGFEQIGLRLFELRDEITRPLDLAIRAELQARRCRPASDPPDH